MSVAYYPLIAGPSGPASYTGNNWSFENGLFTWTPDSLSFQVANTSGSPLKAYEAVSYATFDAFVTGLQNGVMTNDDLFTAAVTQSWTATVRILPQPNSGQVWGRIGLKFLDASLAVLQTSPGSKVDTQIGAGGNQVWQLSTVTAVAPASTAKVKIYVEGHNTVPQNGRVCFDWCTLQKN